MNPVSFQPEQNSLYLLTGPGAPGLLQDKGFSLPEMMQAIRLSEGFLARTGRDEFLLQSESPFTTELPDCWIYSRDDQVYNLQGEYWRAVMAYVCHMDLSRANTDDWLMLSVAGVSVWALVLDDGLRLGCDPSFAEYLQHTLTEVVNRVNEKFN